MVCSLLPAHQLAHDAVRVEIDTFVLKELLEIDAANLTAVIAVMATLRAKLGSEPSFNGGKP